MKRTILLFNLLLVLMTQNIEKVQAQNWLLAGNALGATDWLGSSNVQPLILKTSGTERIRILSGGNVGIGTNAPNSKFCVYESTVLGSTTGNYQILESVIGNAGSSNTLLNSKWVYRDATGSNWYTARLHDGISIDGSYGVPQTSTKVWWERDPNSDIQSWGNSANTYFT